jgi:hypothetical protein
VLLRLFRAAAAAAVIAGAAAPDPAGAQISPGPLARAHESLEGVTNCLRCHGIGEHVQDDRCLECHRAIGWLREQRRGLHGLEAGSECVRCHREHSGRDFELVHWEPGEPEGFDHARAGWPLDGKHAALECRACHKAELRAGAVPGMVDGGLSDRSWLGLETACFACHSDPHEGRLGNACAQCHTTNRWSEIAEAFDHSKTRYALEGKHASVQCAGCHPAGYDRGTMPAFARCTDCHADPHGGQATLAGAAADCASCHTVGGFRPSTFTVARHRDAKYALEGRHAAVACRECHGEGLRSDDEGVRRAAFRFRPESARCLDCHEAAHGRQLASRRDGGACESCHSVEGFRPSRFTAGDHRDTRFPLEGRHAEVACRHCHGPDRPLLPAVVRNEATGPAGVRLRFESLECAECHRDPHEGRFAAGSERGGEKGCLTCHGFESFTTTRIDAKAHAAFGFALAGAHAAVPCFDCHREMVREPGSTLRLASGPALTFRNEDRACADCHRDPHGGQFVARADGGACDACHGADRFVPATLFDHDEDARFPLEGAHRRVACDKCHSRGARTDGTEGVIYRPIVPHRCQDCHGPREMPPLED